jgi:hypothetical protein
MSAYPFGPHGDAQDPELVTAQFLPRQARAILSLLERHSAELPDRDRLSVLAIMRAAAHGVSARPGK